MLKHREFITDEFWKAIPAWKDITEEQFEEVLDSWRPNHIWKKVEGEWKLKHKVDQSGTED